MQESWLRRIGRFLSGEALGTIFNAGLTYILGLGLVGGALAVLQNMPLVQVFFAALSATALAAWTLAQQSVRRSLSSAKYKIVLDAPKPMRWEEGNLIKIRPLITVRNLGNFPIEVDAARVSWTIDRKTGETNVDLQTSSVVPPHGEQALSGPTFSIPKSEFQESGTELYVIELSADLSYGVPGRLRYTYKQDYIIRSHIDPQNPDGWMTWFEQLGRGRYA